MGRSTPTAAHSVGTSTPAANTTVRDGKLPADVSTPTTAASFVRNPRTDSPSRTCAPWRRAASMSASVTATGSTAPSRGRQIASRRATRRFGSRRLISSASASRSSAPSLSVSDSASSPQASDPLQRTRTPGTSRSSRAQSSSAVRRSGVLPSIASPALGPRTQAKESPVTPDAGSDRSMSNTAAPAQAAWYATEAPTMPAPTTTTSVPGEPRTRDRLPDGNGNCPSRRSPRARAGGLLNEHPGACCSPSPPARNRSACRSRIRVGKRASPSSGVGRPLGTMRRRAWPAVVGTRSSPNVRARSVPSEGVRHSSVARVCGQARLTPARRARSSRSRIALRELRGAHACTPAPSVRAGNRRGDRLGNR